MKRIIRLTERDLTKLVKRVIKEMEDDNNQKAEELSQRIIDNLDDKVYDNEITRIYDFKKELRDNIVNIMEDNKFTVEEDWDNYDDAFIIKSTNPEFQIGIGHSSQYNTVELKFDPMGDDKTYIELKGGEENYGDSVWYEVFCTYEESGGVSMDSEYGDESYEEDDLSIDDMNVEVLKNLILNILNSKKNKI